MEKHDIIVIGGGSGGLQLAMHTGLTSKKKVLLLESERTGGECTWSGCVPSKALIHLSKINDRVDIFKKVQKVCETIYHHEDPPAIENLGSTVVEGKGHVSFINKNTVLMDGKEYTADTIVIATGSIASIPPIKGLSNIDYMTNQNVFLQDKLPESIVTIGAGVISLELSLAMAKLGVKITVLEILEKLLPGEDDIVREKFYQLFKDNGVEIICCADITEVKENGNKKSVTYKKDGKESIIEAQKIFVCTGRTVDLEPLKLDNAGIAHTQTGITVNEYMQTNVDGVYAIGDCCSTYKFSHVAGPQGEMLVRNLLCGQNKEKYEVPSMTWCVFTTPEYSRCGLNEKEAKAKSIDYKIYSTDYHHTERPIMSEDTYFFIKVLTHKGLIIGAYCMGERAGDIIATLQIMSIEKISFKNLTNYTLAYPTYIEVIRTLAKQSLND